MLVAGQILLHAVVVALLLRIALVDFKTQKIINRDVLALAALGLAGLVLRALWRLENLQVDVWWNVGMSILVAVVLFLALLPFWVLRKVGAGDVKLMGAAPLVAGAEGMMVFAVLLLVFAALTALAVKNPVLLPAPLFRQYLEHFGRKGVVPFGVPIAFALIGVILLQVFSQAS
jgi:prepilin peptidase CpaA